MTLLPFSDSLSRRARRDIAFCCGVLVVLIGVLGLLPDSLLMQVVNARTAIQALFGLLLCGLVVVRFHWWLQYSPPSQTVDIRRFSRQLSRMIYLVLYLVVGAKQLVGMSGSLQDAPGTAHDLATLKADGQAFLMYGLVALVLVRVLAYWSWRRLATAPGTERR